MEAGLTRQGRAKVFLRDGTYRWVIVKRFAATAGSAVEPIESLACLLRSAAFRDHFSSPDSETDAAIHGPYRLDAVTTDSFELVTTGRAERILQDWIDQFGPVGNDQVEGDLEAVFEIIRRASVCFFLPDLGEQAWHEWGWVVSLFHDLIAVGATREVTLISIGSD